MLNDMAIVYVIFPTELELCISPHRPHSMSGNAVQFHNRTAGPLSRS